MNTLDTLAFGLTFFGSLVLIVYILARYNYLIKKAMIDAKIDIPPSFHKITLIDLGCVFLGIGLGLSFASIFTFFDLDEDTMDMLIYGTLLLFGAFGFFLADFFRKKHENRQK